MKRTYLALPAALCCLSSPALAWDPVLYGDFSLQFSGGVNLTATRHAETVRTAYGYFDSTLTWTHEYEALTFGAELYSMVEFDNNFVGENLAVYGDPYVDVGLWVESESFGFLSYSNQSSAIGEICVEAPSSGDNFGHADYITHGTCPSFDTRSVLYYKSLDLGGGYNVSASYTPNSGMERVDIGAPATSASMAISFDLTDAHGANWTGSFGVEKVLSVDGGGAQATAWQAGVNWAKNGVIVGGAVAFTDLGDGTNDSGIGFAVESDFSDKFGASLGVNWSQSASGETETSLSAIAMYSVVPDKVIIDAGVWYLHSDDGGGEDTRTILGIGASIYF